MRIFKLAGFAVILFLGMAAAAQTVSIQFTNGTFRVSGWKATSATPRPWSAVFAVYVGSGDVPPLAGTYAIEDDSLVFRPAYPIAAGVRYRAVFHPPGGGPMIEKTFAGPPRDSKPSARVLHVYPSADVLPSNLLRLYISFSAPMSRRESAQHVRILDENGKVLPNEFLPGEELWDATFDRLTLTFDPGRIKRGLTSNQKMGPPIVAGKSYTLVIDRDWPDARGAPLLEGFRKSFRGGPAVRNPPDPTTWRLNIPKAGTFEALVVDFPEPMNDPLLHRMLSVSGAGSNVPGSIVVGSMEKKWSFVPRQPWKPQSFTLVVDAALEDLAGNHIGQAFDIDTFQRVSEHITAKSISLPFRIPPK